MEPLPFVDDASRSIAPEACLLRRVSCVWSKVAKPEEADEEATTIRRVKPRLPLPVPPETNLRFFLRSNSELEEGYLPGVQVHGEPGEPVPCAKRVAWL